MAWGSKRKWRQLLGTPMMQAEQLEQRLTMGAPLALSSAGDLLFADPTADDLLEPAVFADSAKTNPASPAPHPVLLTAADEGCCSSAVYDVTIGFVSDVSEATPDLPGYLGIAATTCASNPPTCLTISYSIVGGTATENQDYTGLSGGSVTVPVSFGAGYVQIPWNAVDDDEAEPVENVIVELTGGFDPNGGTVVVADPDQPPRHAEGKVNNGDYYIRGVFADYPDGSFKKCQPTAFTAGGRDFTTWIDDSAVDEDKWPGTERVVAVEIYANKDTGPIKGVEVKLSQLNVAGLDVKVLDKDGKEQTETTVTTGDDGRAYFRLRCKGRDPASSDSEVRFTYKFKNAEGHFQGGVIKVMRTDEQKPAE